MRPNKGSKLLRKGRRSILSQHYLLTTTTTKRENLFIDDEAARLVLSSLLWQESQVRIELLAAVVMPDHVHFIAALKNSDLPQLMHSFKSYTANKINATLDRQSPVWQRSYHDHAIRREEDLNEVIEYLLSNPVRAGLVADLHDYPHWYCRWEV